MNSENSNTNVDIKKETSEIYAHFIDILFAVVIGQSFVLLNSQEGYRSWLAQPAENTFGIATLLLIYGLVITSWVGYHHSIRFYPIKNPLRFVIDISLLFVYYMGFVNAKNFEIIITWVFPFSFLSYTLWDAVRLWEYRAHKSSLKELCKRFLISLFFTLGFFIIAGIYVYVLKEVEWTHGAYFIIILMTLIFYRYLKWYKEPRKMINFKI
jgi:succinate dehydrogenase hydrophobic anchor subunit